MREPCHATTKHGKPCAAQARPGTTACAWHAPELSARRAEWSRKGGEGRSNARRAQKAIPHELRDVADALLRALSAVEAGDLEPSRAQAMSSLARAVVAVQTAGDVEQRLAVLEHRAGVANERTAS